MHGTASDYKCAFGVMGLDTGKAKSVSLSLNQCPASESEC